MTFTRPPIALEPYSRVAGPRTTSMRCAAAGFTVTAWSADCVERSPVRCPSCRMSTRSPPRPRMTGRVVAGPKLRDGDSRFILQRVANGHGELFRQVLTGEHGGRLKDVELASRLGAYRRHLLKVKLRIHAYFHCCSRHRHFECDAGNSLPCAPTRDTCRARGCRTETCHPGQTRLRVSLRR